MKWVLFVLLMIGSLVARADPKFQLGLESGGLLVLPESGGVKFAGCPTYFTEALLIPLSNGWFVRPHLAMGTKLPDRTGLLRVGLFGGKKLADHLAVGMGVIALQAITKNNQYKLSPGGNIALLVPFKWGAPVFSVAKIPGAVIATSGITFNL